MTGNKKAVAGLWRKAIWEDDIGLFQNILKCDPALEEYISFGETPLMMCAARGRADMAALLLEHGADVNRRDLDNCTALMKAANGGHAEVMALLITAGAELNVQSSIDVERHTALSLAAAYGHKDAVALLIDAGADSTLNEEEGYAARYYAASNEIREMIEDAPARQKFLADEKTRAEAETRAIAEKRETEAALVNTRQQRLHIMARRQGFRLRD